MKLEYIVALVGVVSSYLDNLPNEDTESNIDDENTISGGVGD